MNKQRKWARNAVIGGLTVILAASCSGPAQPVAVEPSPTATATPTPTPTPEPVPAFTYPLTGLPVNEEVKQRPIMIMIENSPAARPQTGLHQADWVYEILAEGDITRFAAFYQSESPSVIGPVRSIRPYYVQLGHGHGAIIVHAGWSQDAMNEMKRLKVEHLDQVYGDDKYYWRDNSRKAPHNVYTSIDKVMEGAAAKKFVSEWKGPRPAFAVQSGEAVEAMALPQERPAARVVIPYLSGYRVEYDWDAATRTYQRTMAGKPHTDKDTGERLTATNIIIAETAHKILDKEGRRQVNVTGSGKAILITGGEAADVTWANKDGMVRVFNGEKEIPLAPGKTWVQIVPTGTSVTIE